MTWVCGECGLKCRDAEMRCPACDARERRSLREALEALTTMQGRALAYIKGNGFVFDDIGSEPGNWKHLAFSLYNDLCEVDSIARAALEDEA